jgi:purine nucleosidase
MTIRTILDTDIGTDVDDCLALAFLLGSPEFRLEGVTCVYGDVALRGRMVRKLLTLAGRDDVPVMLGAGEPLLRRRPVYWLGIEGVGLLEPDDDLPPAAQEHAVDFLVRTVMENPGEIHLLAIGPLTNVALAFLREPRLPRALGHLTIMGGAIRGPGMLHLPLAEHNIACDPEAARVVLAAGAPISLVPLDVTTRVEIRQRDIDPLRTSGHPFHAAVAEQVALYPRFVDRGATFLHDPLAVALVVRPDLAAWTDLRVEVETEGDIAAAMTLARTPTPEAPATARVALGIDTAASEAFVAERMLSAVAATAS